MSTCRKSRKKRLYIVAKDGVLSYRGRVLTSSP